MSRFEEVLDGYRRSIGRAREHLAPYGLDGELVAMEADAATLEFRVPVLGPFKSGKSSTLNALVGFDVLPAATRPCTSGLVEIRRGLESAYHVASEGDWEACTVEEFRAGVGSDASDKTGLRRWRVDVPIDWLPAGLTFVDTPGTSDDVLGSSVAAMELQRADAAVLLLDARRGARIEDAAFVNALVSQGEHLVVVVNQIDLIKRPDRERVLEHVRTQLSRVGLLNVRLLPFSAKEASRRSGDGAAMLAELRETLSVALLGSAAGERLAAMRERSARSIAELKARIASANAPRESKRVSRFEEVLDEYRRSLGRAREHLAPFGLDGDLVAMEAEASRLEFRVPVLGRFKSGKSSALNALIGLDVLPVDTLACTSGLVEIRKGIVSAYYVAADGGWDGCTGERFRAGAGSAATGKSELRSWRVELPIDWLPSGLTFVDTPGTNEDELRSSVAAEELKRADAAVVLLSARQAAGIEDEELVNALISQVDHLVVVVNRIDEVELPDRERVLKHVRARLSRIGLPDDRVLPFSAKDASRRVGDGPAMLEALREALSAVLLGSAAAARLAVMCRRATEAIAKLDAKIGAAIATREAIAQAAAGRAVAAYAALASFRSDSSRMLSILSDCSGSAERDASDTMRDNWEGIVRGLETRQNRWSSDSDPVFQPKAFAGEIGEAAKRDLEGMIKQFVVSKIQPSVSREVERAGSSIRREVERIVGVDPDGRSREAFAGLADLQRKAFEDAFGRAVDGATAGSGDAAVAAVVSAVVGYIVADVILFYVLGVISGFLNPALLAAAGLVGVAAYLFKGRDWIRAHIRSRIAQKLVEGLLAPQVKTKVVHGTAAGVRELFTKLTAAYGRQLDRAIEGAKRDCENCAREAAGANEEAKQVREVAKGAAASLDWAARQLAGVRNS